MTFQCDIKTKQMRNSQRSKTEIVSHIVNSNKINASQVHTITIEMNCYSST